MAISDWIKLVLDRFKRVLIIASVTAAIIWFIFFDSYSVVMRVQNHREKASLTQNNALLRSEISVLEEKLSRPLTDVEVERIAREEYRMSKSDETVYPVDAQ